MLSVFQWGAATIRFNRPAQLSLLSISCGMDEVREKEMELMRRLIRTLEDENNSKNLERNSLHLEIDRLQGELANLQRQLDSEKRNSHDLTEMLEVLPAEVETELEQLRSKHQVQFEEIEYLKNEV